MRVLQSSSTFSLPTLSLHKHFILFVLIFLLLSISKSSAAQQESGNLKKKNTCISADALEIVESRIKEDSQQQEQKQKQLRWAIVALTRSGRTDINIRNEALAEKIRPYATKHDISIVFFSEMVIPSNSIAQWQKTFKNIASVVVINTASRGYNLPERYGYKYMCKFFSLDLYDYLANNYDYYMRCDSDCYLKRMQYDIFEWAEVNKVGYGFSMRKIEAHGPTKQTLPVWTATYLDRCNLEPTAVMDKPLSVCFNFYNNWHIGKVSFFNRPDVRHFLESVNASGHIQSHRWGDSTIQAYAVRLFMDPKAIVQVPNFTYVHGSHSKQVTTFGDGSLTDVPQRLPNWRYSPSSVSN